jgi:uncharacterized protein YjlB
MNKPRAETAAVQTLMFERNQWVPNNPRLPVLIYPTALFEEPSSPMAGHHNGDMGFTTITTTIQKVMKCLASPAVGLG